MKHFSLNLCDKTFANVSKLRIPSLLFSSTVSRRPHNLFSQMMCKTTTRKQNSLKIDNIWKQCYLQMILDFLYTDCTRSKQTSLLVEPYDNLWLRWAFQMPSQGCVFSLLGQSILYSKSIRQIWSRSPSTVGLLRTWCCRAPTRLLFRPYTPS